MGLKIMCAGCSKDEREQAEAVVRSAVGPAADTDAWTISLVKLGGQWSVTLDARTVPGRGRTLMTPASRLGEAIAEAIRAPKAEAPEGKPAPAATARTAAAAAAMSTPAAGVPAIAAPPAIPGAIACKKCGHSFKVVYDAQPGEPLQEAPVACPYCWQMNKVEIGLEAAETSDYRAEKLEG